ncbi:MAG: class I SAM-dependent methyltransferase [Candidatus Obscuribacterales bacterium]|nr:class I SAM-dependent methyltransferase [Candidatus Obscuribacterales bacterium]
MKHAHHSHAEHSQEYKYHSHNLGTQHTFEFVKPFAKTGASVLDVGCGTGELAELLQKGGLKVKAIDAHEQAIEKAAARGVNAECVGFLEFQSKEKFDLIVFSRSFHHIHPVEKTAEHAHALLKDDGVLLLDEFGVELVDEKTACWFYGLKSVLQSSSAEPKGHGPKLEDGLLPSNPLQNWRDHHLVKHEVADSVSMIDGLKKYFEIKVEYRPYLYLYFLDQVNEEQAQRIIDWETALCESGSISRVGMRIVAKKL